MKFSLLKFTFEVPFGKTHFPGNYPAWPDKREYGQSNPIGSKAIQALRLAPGRSLSPLPGLTARV
jgi:hypothetical protein